MFDGFMTSTVDKGMNEFENLIRVLKHSFATHVESKTNI